MNSYFLKAIIGRRKKWIHTDNVRTVNVPYFRNLTVEAILEFIQENPEPLAYLPDSPDLEKIPRKFLIDVCAVTLGETFKDWVSVRIDERNAQMADNRDFMIEMDPEIAARFHQSTHISRKCLANVIFTHLIYIFRTKGYWRESA